MKITRTIAISLLLAGVAPAVAQPLRDARPPAEFPPSSYTARQYVDSQGCIYIRAGIDGTVTWVPRVDRARRQVCGYQPSLSEAQRAELASGSGGRASTTGPVEIIELDPSDRATASAGSSTPSQVTTAPRAPSSGPAPTVFTDEPSAPAPRVTTAPESAPTAPDRKPSPGPEPTVFTNVPAAEAAPQPAAPPRTARQTAPARQPSAGPAPTVFTSTAPAKRTATAKVTTSSEAAQAGLSPDTRAVRRHIYENRKNAGTFTVPKGYRPVWTDDRLNPKRAEMTLRPSVVTHGPAVPKGYRPAWDDDRLNPKRALVSQTGEAQTDRIWSKELPRRLLPQDASARAVTVDEPAVRGNSPFWTPPVAQTAPVARVSTRSAPANKAGNRGGSR
ncbi:SPOR domain-containing protein [Sulfitobacter sp. BDSS02]|nr:SPOR domain-containing protein [Sulfitobacter sp. BDSS02]MBR9849080.1 SPOR domain-containing protein [Paracoccaceae bacterium]